MIDTMMLLGSLVGFAGLVIGWMVLPDAPAAEGTAVSTAPVARAA